MTLRQNVVLMILLTLICSPLFLQAASSLTATRPAARITHVLLSTYADKDGNFYTGPLSRTRDIQSSTFLSSIRIRGGGLALGRTSTNASSQKEDPQPLLSKLLNVLFKGVTMPFPTLRKLSETSQDDNRKMRVGFSLRESIMAIVIYLALGVVSYSSTILQHDQAWSFVDALYFGGMCVLA